MAQVSRAPEASRSSTRILSCTSGDRISLELFLMRSTKSTESSTAPPPTSPFLVSQQGPLPPSCGPTMLITRSSPPPNFGLFRIPESSLMKFTFPLSFQNYDCGFRISSNSPTNRLQLLLLSVTRNIQQSYGNAFSFNISISS